MLGFFKGKKVVGRRPASETAISRLSIGGMGVQIHVCLEKDYLDGIAFISEKKNVFIKVRMDQRTNWLLVLFYKKSFAKHIFNNFLGDFM